MRHALSIAPDCSNPPSPMLTSRVYAGVDDPMRYAGVTMSMIFLVGLAAVPFAPETKGRPLPE